MMMPHQSIQLPNDLRTWTNGSSPIPAWVREQMTGGLAPNGTFLIKTPLGAARVHVGSVVVEHVGGVWSRSPDELPQFIEALNAEALPASAAVGPGKSALFGIRSKAGNRAKRGADRKMPFRKPLGSMPSIEWVHTSELTVDQSYQRSIENEGSRRLIAGIPANFDWRLCAPLVVSRRSDGSKVVIDGQHRWAAAVRRGDLPQLPCCLFTYASPEDEARMFILANRARKPMNRLDDFHAALAAADEDALEILRLVTEAGLSMARNTAANAWRPGQVAFTSSIATALRRHGEAIVSAALTCIAEAFEGQALVHGASLFGGLVKIFAQPPEGFDPDKLAIALRTFDVIQWGGFVKDQKGGDARSVAMYAAMLDAMSRVNGDVVAA
jgi:hypothetical protein